ncbi:MAG: glycogen-binding domain-containing protein [Candidatus Omnitrophica bacterium]|nr:glycogen-binding domain-containing protein [Candidatus Omnitrophota bacterium]
MAKATGSSVKSSQFKFFAPQAKKVSLAGSFNNWDTNSLVAKKDTKGAWSLKVGLKPGKYEYKFFVDGTWLLDPACKSKTSNNLGSENSVIEIK